MAVKVGDVGIDFSGADLAPATVKANGAAFVIRYSAGVGNSQQNTQWKLCKPGEIKAITAAGMDFIANSEWYESRVTEGAAAGLADGKADLKFWQSRGLAKGKTIYVSWDAAPVQSKWAAVDAYFAAYERGLSGYYQAASAYAGTPYLRHSKRRGWRPNAGSWSNDGLPYQPPNHGRGYLQQALAATPAHIWQTGNYWFNKNADENLILRVPVGSQLEGSGGGTTVALTKADAASVWTVDVIPIDPTNKANPNWRPASVLVNMRNIELRTQATAEANARALATIVTRLATLQKDVALLKTGGVDVSGIADKVVSEIADRLGGTSA